MPPRFEFEAVYARVEKCSHETAFNKEEAKALFELLHLIPPLTSVLEVGVEFGRSTTVIGHMAKERNLNFVAIDPFIGEYGQEARAHVETVLIGEWELPIHLLALTSIQAAVRLNLHRCLSLVHIDGDHRYESVIVDCALWLPKVRVGGYACFDDYGHDSLPDVYRAVSHWMTVQQLGEWEFVGRYGGKLGVFRRVEVRP